MSGNISVRRVLQLGGATAISLLLAGCFQPMYAPQAGLDLRGTGGAFDGGIEGVEDPAARFRVGVLWHPEQGTDPRLFTALLAAA